MMNFATETMNVLGISSIIGLTRPHPVYGLLSGSSFRMISGWFIFQVGNKYIATTPNWGANKFISSFINFWGVCGMSSAWKCWSVWR